MSAPRLAVVAAALIAVSLPAIGHADPGELSLHAHPHVPHRNPSTAIALSTLATIGSVVVLGSSQIPTSERGTNAMLIAGGLGLMIAPSLGHFYADDVLSNGLLLRLGGAAAIGGGLLLLGDPFSPAGGTVIAIGAGAIVTGAIWDFATAGSAADRFNEEHQLRLAPTIVTTGHGAAAGFGLTARF